MMTCCYLLKIAHVGMLLSTEDGCDMLTCCYLLKIAVHQVDILLSTHDSTLTVATYNENSMYTC